MNTLATGTDTSGVTSSKQRRAWSAVFRRSRISPHVFVIADDAAKEVDRVVAGLGLPEASSNNLFDNAHWVTPLLDGAVARLLTYGFPALPSGTRVYGHRAFDHPAGEVLVVLDVQPCGRDLADGAAAEVLARADPFPPLTHAEHRGHATLTHHAVGQRLRAWPH